MNELLTVVTVIYDIVAFSGATLLMYVLYLAINDLHLNRTDHPSVIKARKNVFYADAIFLVLTAIFQNYWLTSIPIGLVAIGFVLGGEAILTVNVVSLHMRAPPNPGHGYQPNPARAHWWRRI